MRGRKPLEISGKRFGRLVAIKRIKKWRTSYWICQCDCGKIKSIRSQNLVRGYAESCGCLRGYIDSSKPSHRNSSKGLKVGKYERTPEVRNKNSNGSRGHRMSEESKRKQAEHFNHPWKGKRMPPEMREFFSKMRHDWFLGRKHTEETKKKMVISASKVTRKNYQSRISKPHRLFVQLFKNKFGIDLQIEFPLVMDSGQYRYYDCKVPNSNILFEIDGIYWHSLPNSKRNDSVKDALAQRLGYILYRIPENKVVEFITVFRLTEERVKVQSAGI